MNYKETALVRVAAKIPVTGTQMIINRDIQMDGGMMCLS